LRFPPSSVAEKVSLQIHSLPIPKVEMDFTGIPLPKRFGLRPTFSREYILDSKWFGVPARSTAEQNHFVVGIVGLVKGKGIIIR
jgi:hypothetical protein